MDTSTHFKFIVFKPYNKTYFAVAVLHNDAPLDMIDVYTTKIFQYMIKRGMVNDDEMMISLNVLITMENAHIVVIKRFTSDFGISLINVIDKILTILEHDDRVAQELFVVSYDLDDDLVYLGGCKMITLGEFEELKERVLDMFGEFPEIRIDYLVTEMKLR